MAVDTPVYEAMYSAFSSHIYLPISWIYTGRAGRDVKRQRNSTRGVGNEEMAPLG